jgi:NADH-quinone oxidoreductase subunit M
VLFRICAVAGVIGMSLAAAYSLRVLRLVWAGHENWTGPVLGSAPRRRGPDDAHGAELVVVLALVALVIGLGVLPKPLLGVTEPDTAVLVPRSAPVLLVTPASGPTVLASGP